MKELTIYSNEIEKWMEETFQMYSCGSVEGKRLHFSVNMKGCCRVMWGEDILFVGDSIVSATRAFNLCESP